MAIAGKVPARPDGVELIGEMEGSGYRTPPSLVRRHDGQTVQLTPLLYAVLEAVDGRRDYPEIAKRVSARTGRTVTRSDVETLVEEQLRPMGLLLQADGTAPELKRQNPLLGLRFKVAVTDPAVTRRLTEPFTALFHPLVWVPIVVTFVALAWWLLMDRGLAAATYQAFAKPSLLVLVLFITVLSAGFHEFGHAAAARRGGAQPGVMGAGLYLLWPAFYTDVTDSYRLGRFARLRTDLGGLYFNAIVAVAIVAVWWLSGWDALLLIVAAQILQMIRQLIPLVRFDGYHVLADMIGVPDLFSRIGPILMSFWPTRWRDPRVTQLKLSARLLVTAWVLVVVPVLLFTLLAVVLAIPRLLGTAWESLLREQAQIGRYWAAGQQLDALGSAIAMFAICLPVLGLAYMLIRVAVGAVRTLWRRTEGHALRRAGATGVVVATLAAVVLAWWPLPDRYRPVQPYERGTLFDLAVFLGAPGDPGSAGRQRAGGEVHTVLPRSAPLPTEGEPQLAVVLVPSSGSAEGGSTDPAWVFPFNRPLPPEPGDNQAQAVNTTNFSTTYDVAIAMVWVTGESPVLNVNEAYAFASCFDCVTVAVAFQVVVIVGSANVVVPQNLAAAVNYNCFECITAAIASQLVVTVDSLPGVEQQIALADIWADIAAFASTIPTLPLADVIAQLEEYKLEILTILDVAPLPAPSATPAPSGSLPAATTRPSGGASPGVSTTPNPGATISPTSPTPPPGSSSPAPTPSGTPAPTSGPTGSLEPSPTAS